MSGCLSEADLRALQGARPGQAPPALAQHLAGCSRCQQRLLTRDRTPGDRRGASAATGLQLRRWAWVGGALLLLLIAGLIFAFILVARLPRAAG